MNNSNLDYTSIRNDLNQIYQELSTVSKKIVQLFSIIYGTINRNDFISCVSSCRIRDDKDKALTLKTLGQYINNLIDLGVLVQKRGKGAQCHPLLTEIATRDAVKQKSFELFAKITEQKLSNNSSYSRYCWEDWYFLRKIRIAVYSYDLNALVEEFEDYTQYHRYGYDQDSVLSWEDILLSIFNNPFDINWLFTFPLPFFEAVTSSILSASFCYMINMDELFDFVYRA